MLRIELRRLRAALTGLFVLALAVALAACGKEDGATGVPATLEFGATTTGAGPAARGEALPMVIVSPDVTVDTFRLGAREIELERLMAVEEESGVEFEGRFVVDVLAGATLSALLPTGTYQELELKLEPLDGVNPAGGDATALLIEGSYNSTVAGGLESFTIRVDAPFKLEVEGPNGITLDGSSNDLLVMFRLDAMFTVAVLDELRALATPGDGSWTLFIDGATPLATLTAVQDVVHDALEFGEDHDHDHDLNEAEDVDDDTLL